MRAAGFCCRAEASPNAAFGKLPRATTFVSLPAATPPLVQAPKPTMLLGANAARRDDLCDDDGTAPLLSPPCTNTAPAACASSTQNHHSRSRPPLEKAYLHLHSMVCKEHATGERALGLTAAPRSGPADRARWAATRARCCPHGTRPRPGTAQSQRQALRLAHGQTLVCLAPGCTALVDLQAARRCARASGRDAFEPGDGCASPACSACSWPARFEARQRRMAIALLTGERSLVLWPASTHKGVPIWHVPRSLMLAAACGVLRRLARGRCR